MCMRLGCPFQSVRRPPDDGFIRILIIGATGMTGTSVVSAALTCIWFKVTIFTRQMSGKVVDEMRKKSIQKVVEGDLFNYDSVLAAMEGIDTVFFSTTYWDTMRVECEFDQGYHVVKACKEAGVKHLFYVGTPYTSILLTEQCKYLQGKEKVEAHIVASGIPYTILHLGFYFENFISVFKPHEVEKGVYAVALPMGNVGLNCGSVRDFGHCIGKLMLRPAHSVYKSIKLATGYYTVTELAMALDDHFDNLTFFDPKIPLSAYRAFEFKGSQELASMFAYYQTITEQWSPSVAYNLFSNCRSFSEWVQDEEVVILEVLTEQLDPVTHEVIPAPPIVQTQPIPILNRMINFFKFKPAKRCVPRGISKTSEVDAPTFSSSSRVLSPKPQNRPKNSNNSIIEYGTPVSKRPTPDIVSLSKIQVKLETESTLSTHQQKSSSA